MPRRCAQPITQHIPAAQKALSWQVNREFVPMTNQGTRGAATPHAADTRPRPEAGVLLLGDRQGELLAVGADVQDVGAPPGPGGSGPGGGQLPVDPDGALHLL